MHYSCIDVFFKQANNRLAKRGGHTMAITPRHYLDFINQYANLFNEKRSELEEQQMHLNVGLRKIKETVDQVMQFLYLLLDIWLSVSLHALPALVLLFICLEKKRWRNFVVT